MLLVSLVVIAKNEEDRIERCLSSALFVDEILVLDSGSTDQTVAVALRAGAKVIETDWSGHVEQKNRAMSMAKNEWVLSLDADEALSSQAAQFIQSLDSVPDGVDGFEFNRCSEWLGVRLRHGKWYPDRRVRLARKSSGQWGGDNPHDTLRVKGAVKYVDVDIDHWPYRSLSEHLQTIDKYTEIAANTLYLKGTRASIKDLLLRPPAHFISAIIFKRGILDGAAGVVVAWLGAVYTLLKWYRLFRIQNGDLR